MCLQNLVKAIRVKEGLPESLLSSIPADGGEHFPGQHERVEESVRETYLCDATQVRMQCCPHHIMLKKFISFDSSPEHSLSGLCPPLPLE